MVKPEERTNAETLRAIYNLNKAYKKENYGASLISDKLVNIIEDCMENSKTDEEFNKRFNAQLEASAPRDDYFATKKTKSRRK